MQHFYFRPRWIPALATLVTMALFIHLGNWQSDKGNRVAAQRAQFAQRAQQPAQAIGAALADPQALQYLPIQVRGRYQPEAQFLLDNQQENGVPGVQVITPLLIDGSHTRILVNRGWIAWGVSRQRLPVVTAPTGLVQVRGIASIPVTKKLFFLPDRDDPQGQLWSRIDLERFARLHGGPLQPLVLLQASDDSDDALVRHWQAPEDRVAMHRSYSLQWYAMAAGLLFFFLVASWRKKVPT